MNKLTPMGHTRTNCTKLAWIWTFSGTVGSNLGLFLWAVGLHTVFFIRKWRPPGPRFQCALKWSEKKTRNCSGPDFRIHARHSRSCEPIVEHHYLCRYNFPESTFRTLHGTFCFSEAVRMSTRLSSREVNQHGTKHAPTFYGYICSLVLHIALRHKNTALHL